MPSAKSIFKIQMLVRLINQVFFFSLLSVRVNILSLQDLPFMNYFVLVEVNVFHKSSFHALNIRMYITYEHRYKFIHTYIGTYLYNLKVPLSSFLEMRLIFGCKLVFWTFSSELTTDVIM